MNHDSPFEFPEISDDDIRWASRLLDLRDDAFYGTDGTDPRQQAIKSKEQIDIAACPGSGKTTLLVAKLAILAKNWQHRTRGICVLSHTNAARHVIESRLGNTPVGRLLLSYPHFVGTIHHFVNDYFAVPWLRSQGNPITMIDTDICQKRRWNAIPLHLRRNLERNHHGPSILSATSTDFDLGQLRWKPGLLGRDKETYRTLQDKCRQSVAEGYFCYDEMFVWARELMETVPAVVKVIRDRFPLLFIDEAQDTTENQSEILYRIFMDGDGKVSRQRFGDSNQAIFYSDNSKEAATDRFPNGKNKEIPNSHRFGESIAKLAGPLGITPYSVALKGHGRKSLASGATEGCHTVFLFADSQGTKILDAYGDLLLSTFSDEELQDGSRNGSFTAVGHVHFDKGDDHWPRHIGHYFPEYDPELSKAEPRPSRFLGYVCVGVERAIAHGEAYHAVEKVAEGLLRLAEMADNRRFCSNRRYSHRYVFQRLEQHDDLRERYVDFVSNIVIKQRGPRKQPWEDRWCKVVRQIAERVAEVSLTSAEADEFLSWADAPAATASHVNVAQSRDNMYRYFEDGKEVAIRVGSIHSVKGQTHTATLVLDTFWQDNKGRHNLEMLRDWLCGIKSGAASAGVQQKARLKLHYVAMTRPTHLLCLAMKKRTFQNERGELDRQLTESLKNHGWHVESI